MIRLIGVAVALLLAVEVMPCPAIGAAAATPPTGGATAASQPATMPAVGAPSAGARAAKQPTSAPTTAPAAEPGKSWQFTFTVLADAHVGVPEYDEAFANVIENISGDFVVFAGDIVDTATPQAIATFERTIAGLRIPYYVVLGNHDVSPKNVQDMTRRFGPLMRKVEYKGVVLLFVCTEPLLHQQYWKKDAPDVLAWVQQALEEAGDKPVLIFTHIPLEVTWTPEQRQRWLEMIHSHNVKAMFAGHLHEDQLIWYGDIPEHIAPPVAPRAGQLLYRVYTYDSGRIGYYTRYLRYHPAPPKPAQTQPAK